MAVQLKDWLHRLRRSFPRTSKSQGDAHTSPRRRRRRRRLMIGIVLTLLAYPVLGTVALWTGLIERMVRSEDLRLEISKPAWTIWPGKVHMDAARILVNGETQFTLQGDDIVAHVNLFRLLGRHFHVSSIEASDVRYRMRVQVKSKVGIEERLAAYPPLEDLPGDPTLIEGKAAKTEKRESDWKVQVEGIDVRVVELWFMEYRYLGDGRLRGAFLVGPKVMDVETSVQDLGPGELRFGPKQLIAKNVRGAIVAEIPQNNPEEHADESFLNFVTAHIKLKADVQTLRHLDAYLDGVNVRDGAGPFQVDLSMKGGHLGRGSNLSFSTDTLKVLAKGVGVESDWNLSVRTDAPGDAKNLPHIESGANSTYVSFTGRSKNPFTIQLHDHEQSATLGTTSLAKLSQIKAARLRFPKIVSRDFDDLNALTSERSPFQTQAGSARAVLDLRMDDKRVLRGPLKVAFDDAKFRVAGVRLGGDGRAQTRVRIDLNAKTTRLDDVSLALSDFEMHVGDEHVEDWWMKLTSDRFSAWGLPPKRTQASFAVVAKDAEPLLEALAEKNKLHDLIAKFTSLDDLSVRGTLRTGEKMTDLVLETLESDVFDISGRIYTKGEEHRSALLIGGKTISVGIATSGTDTEIKPFAKTDWLNEKLRHFPKPVERVKPPKP